MSLDNKVAMSLDNNGSINEREGIANDRSLAGNGKPARIRIAIVIALGAFAGVGATLATSSAAYADTTVRTVRAETANTMLDYPWGVQDASVADDYPWGVQDESAGDYPWGLQDGEGTDDYPWGSPMLDYPWGR
ncbi:MAG TPA: hypothetical protein VFV66_18040 [Nonomuraea sp.]|nr:hypothetical protein [Nonomuraea sp.]